MPQHSNEPESGSTEPSGRGAEQATRIDRRTAIVALASGVAGGFAGCSTGQSFSDADIVAGPDGNLAFEPITLTITAGETVRWGFESAGHNVCCRPTDHDAVSLPDDAQPFASYSPDESPKGSLVPRGGIFEHTFEVPGTYQYVCVPHAPQGMTGGIRVE